MHAKNVYINGSVPVIELVARCKGGEECLCVLPSTSVCRRRLLNSDARCASFGPSASVANVCLKRATHKKRYESDTVEAFALPKPPLPLAASNKCHLNLRGGSAPSMFTLRNFLPVCSKFPSNGDTI